VEEQPRLALAATGGFHEPYWAGGSREGLGFFHVKGMLEAVLDRLGMEVEFEPAADVAYLHPGVACRITSEGAGLGVLGELHPEVAERFKFVNKVLVAELSLDPIYRRPVPEPRYESLNRFPTVERDFSFLLDRTVSFSRIKKLVQSLGIAELQSLRLIDLYRGSGLPQDKVSLTVRLTFEDRSRTLQQSEIGERCDRVVTALIRQFGIEQR
jgi:phenylalanyl-tRNA synthetase beta chain